MNACNRFCRSLRFESLSPRLVMAVDVFYLDPVHGDDSALGRSIESAWKSPANFVSYYSEADRPVGHQQLGPGDTIYVLPGEVDFSYLYDGRYESLFLRGVHGEPDAPIRLLAMPGAKLRSQAPDGSEMNAIHLLASSHIDISGFDVTSKGSAIRLADTRFIGIHDNFIHDVDGWANDNLSGIYLTDAHSSTLKGNLLRDIYDRNQPQSQNNRPIVIFGSMDVRVLDNVVWNSQPETGFGIEYKHLGSLTPAQAAAMTFEVAGNTIINVGGNGVGTSAPNSWIHHNLLVDAGGIRVDDIGGTHQLAGELIEYNTIVNAYSDRLGSGSLAYDPTETVDSPRGAFPLGTVDFVHNLVVDRRAYDHPERRTLSVYRYGSDNEYRASIGMGKFRSDRNFFDTQSSALFDLFGSDYESLGGDFDFSQWQAMGFDRSGTTGDAILDDFFRPNHSDARQTGWYAGSEPRLALIPLDRNLSEAGIGSEQRIRVTRSGGSLSLPLAVTLSTTGVGQISLPAQVTIPAGSEFAEFVVQGVADSIEEGQQAILIHAATAELATSTWLILADSELDPHAIVGGVFQVPGSAGVRVNMNSVVTERLAEYDNELGWAYVDDAQGRVNGLLPADVGWLSELLTRSAPQTVFSSGATEGNRSSVELEAGRFGVWYLVQDAGLEDWLFLNPENSLSVRPLVFTSIANANPDRYQHLRSTTTESQWQLAWEDQEFGGDESFRDFSISVAFFVNEPSAMVEFSLLAVDSQGAPLTSVCVGDDFFIEINARDLRNTPSGLFSAGLDVEFSSALAEVNGPLQFGDRFVNRQTGNASALGLIDEISAVADGSLGIADNELFVRIPLRAIGGGTFHISTNPAEVLPAHEVTLNGLDSSISQEQIAFGFKQIEIWPSNKWHNKRLQEDVNGDGQVSPIDALRIINFINRHGVRSGLSAPEVDAFLNGSFLDVNNDDSITALDALLVINRLNME